MPISRDWHDGSITLDDADDVALAVRVAGEADSFSVTAGGVVTAAGLAVLAGYTQTYATADKTHAGRTAAAPAAATASSVATTGATAVTPNGYTTAAQANAIVTAINALIVDAADLRTQLAALRVDQLDTAQVVNSMIDDLEA